jgi:enamine deaminase RidA (YjgF/YER057c/UK114 family)
LNGAKVLRKSADDIQWAEVNTGSSRHFHITAHCGQGSDCSAMCQGFVDLLLREKASPIIQDEFCSCACTRKWRDSMATTGQKPEWPVTWLEGHDSPAGLANGFQAWAVSGAAVERIEHKGRIVGSHLEDDEAVYLVLGDLRPTNTDCSRGDQAQQVFDTMLQVLSSVGMTFDQVVRTWLYMDHILDWYDEFNVVRNNFFEQHGIFDRMVPASTGIGCAHPAGSAMIAKLLAVLPKKGKVFEVESPLQCPATDYRSAFSRAAEVSLPSHRQLYVSGTASIEPGGATIHIDDTARQIDLTMEVVQAILESRGMEWSDTTRAVAYLRDNNERPLLENWLARNAIRNMPLVTVQSDVCRDDLLYEIELDAIRMA